MRLKAESPLPIYRIYEAGEPIYPKSNKIGTVNGVCMLASEASGYELAAQYRDAERFLFNWSRTLVKIEYDSLTLDFGIFVAADEVHSSRYEPPKQLRRLCEALGATIEHSEYPVANP